MAATIEINDAQSELEAYRYIYKQAGRFESELIKMAARYHRALIEITEINLLDYDLLEAAQEMQEIAKEALSAET